MRSITRRNLLAGVAAAALLVGSSNAPGFLISGPADPPGWRVLPLGCGGLVTGHHITSDGSIVCRSDVGNCYYWSGRHTATFSDPTQKWLPVFSYASMPVGFKTYMPTTGGYDIALADSDPTHMYVIAHDDEDAGGNVWSLYYSTNCFSSQILLHKAVAPSFANADPNATGDSGWKNASGKVVVDPANRDVVYLGMPRDSGTGNGCYRAINGVNFSVVTSNGSTPLPEGTVGGGTTGIIFDPSQGTVTVGGQLRTKRVLIPIGGRGIWESTDGGVSFTEVYVSAGNSSTFFAFNSKVDFGGLIYFTTSNGVDGVGGDSKLMRYRSGAWANLFAAKGWVTASYLTTAQNTLICDGRSGHQGYLTINGPNGFGVGFTSTNANAANPDDIVWGGSTGGQTITQAAASYDVPWLAFSLEQTEFFPGTFATIDNNGDCWCSGQQGCIWKYGAIPNFGLSLDTTFTTTSRGAECTVSSDVCSSPGAPYPTMFTQDVGVMRGTLTSYPENYYKNQNRLDAMLGDWCSSDPSIYLGKVDAGTSGAGFFAGQSNNYGATEPNSWTPYGVSPNEQWVFEGTADISNGMGGSGTILNVTAVASGNVMSGQYVYIGGVFKGIILGEVAGGVGTYTLDTASLTASGATEGRADAGLQSGLIVGPTPDNNIAIPMGFDNRAVPAYTTNATSPTPTWQLCQGLPAIKWFNRPIGFGCNARPMAADRVTIGTVLFADTVTTVGQAKIYRSTNGGATATLVATITNFGAEGGAISPFLYSVPGHAGHFLLSAKFGIGTGGKSGMWRTTDAGDTWARIGIKASFTGNLSDSPTGGGSGDGPWLWVTGPVTGVIEPGMAFDVGGTRFQITGDVTGGGGPGIYLATVGHIDPTAITAVRNPGSTGFEFVNLFTIGKAGPSASYPTIFAATWDSSGNSINRTIYYSTDIGDTWAILGATGTQRDFPQTMQLVGNPGGIAGDWNRFLQLYAMSAQCGYAYYNP